MQPERKLPPLTYNGLRQIILEAIPPMPSDDKPGIRIQFGGEFDGKERAFIDCNWGRSLLWGTARDNFIRAARQRLDPAIQEHRLHVVENRMRDKSIILIVQSK